MTVIEEGLRLRPPAPFDTADWDAVCTRHQNALLEGSPRATANVLRLLRPHLRHPIIWTPTVLPLEVPRRPCGTFVLPNLSAITQHEQLTLLRWLDRTALRTQVVSTSAHPVYPLITLGRFSDELYYRLNVVLLATDALPVGAADRRLTSFAHDCSNQDR